MSPIKFYEPNEENGWLANFSYHSFVLEGKRWDTVEHYFQQAKFDDLAIKTLIINASSPLEAKVIARKYKDRRKSNWGKIKVEIMYEAIKAKFEQNPEVRKKLLDTKTDLIIEDAKDDSYWGNGWDGNGDNVMGKLLMKLRTELTNKQI